MYYSFTSFKTSLTPRHSLNRASQFYDENNEVKLSTHLPSQYSYTLHYHRLLLYRNSNTWPSKLALNRHFCWELAKRDGMITAKELTMDW